MTTVEALKELFLALGGDADDVETITTNPEMVHAIAEVAGGAIELPKVTSEDAGDILAVDESGKWAKTEPESGLPDVTAEDNGDVLAVVDGAWAKAASNKLIIHATAPTDFSYESPKTMTFEKSCHDLYTEIITAGIENTVVVASYSSYKLIFLPIKVSGTSVSYYTIGRDNNSAQLYWCYFYISRNESLPTASTSVMKLTPAAS